MKIILISAPAAGKGTQAKMLANQYNIPHISLGDILRKEMEDKSVLGKQVKAKIDNGELIEDDIIIKILNERLKQEDAKQGYVLDGFPRTLKQATMFLKENNLTSIYIFYLQIDEENAKKRIVERKICNNCNAIYNESNMKPLKANICDKCQKELVKRKDDNEETFMKRYNEYLEKTKPIIDQYQHQTNFYEINCNKEKEEVFKDIITIIEGVKNG